MEKSAMLEMVFPLLYWPVKLLFQRFPSTFPVPLVFWRKEDGIYQTVEKEETEASEYVKMDLRMK